MCVSRLRILYRIHNNGCSIAAGSVNTHAHTHTPMEKLCDVPNCPSSLLHYNQIHTHTQTQTRVLIIIDQPFGVGNETSGEGAVKHWCQMSTATHTHTHAIHRRSYKSSSTTAHMTRTYRSMIERMLPNNARRDIYL